MSSQRPFTWSIDAGRGRRGAARARRLASPLDAAGRRLGIVVLPVVVMLTAPAPSLVRTAFDGLVMYRWQVFGIGLAVWQWSRGRLGAVHLVALVAAGLAAEYVHTPDVPSVLVLGLAIAGIATAAAGRGW